MATSIGSSSASGALNSTTISAITGQAAGIDTGALVDSIVAQTMRPATLLQQRQTTDKAIISGLTDFQTLLGRLDTAAQQLGGGISAGTTAFDARSITVDTGSGTVQPPVSVTASPGTDATSFTVSVQNLATAQKTVAGTGASASGVALGYSGTFDVRRGTAGGADDTLVGSVTVTPTDTLTSIRDKLNALNTTAGAAAAGGTTASAISASVVGFGASDQRLSLTSQQTGVAQGFRLVSTSGTALASLGLDATAPTGGPITRAASDAAFTIDGIPTTRGTNTVSDLAPGVTMTLTGTTATGSAPATVSVEPSTAVIQSAAQSFADAYNAVVDAVKTATAASSASGLAGNPLLRGSRVGLTNTLLGTATGTGVSPSLNTLASVGLHLDKTGHLSVDTSGLTAALGRPGGTENVQALFADRFGALSKVADGFGDENTGQIQQQIRATQDRDADYDRQIAAITARGDAKRLALQSQFAKFQAALSQMQSLQSSLSAQWTSLNKSSSN